MYRVKKLGFWRKHKKPKDGQTYAKSGHCLSDHFHRSGLEIKTCNELRLRKIAGEIHDYKVEVPFDLELDGLKMGRYYADFLVQHKDGTEEVVEAKGLFFGVFKQKWKILEHMYRNDPTMKLTIVTK